MAGRLSEERIQREVESLTAWTRNDAEIHRRVVCEDFRGAMLFVNAVAYLAEKANHHPDIHVAYRTVTLTLTSHDAGGLTGRDFDLARRIDALL